MKELSLQEVHQEDLKILLDVHDFCEANGIKYSLAYGTLLGAVRHGGFIPWDDDIDIMMPRQEYDKFCKIYSSNRYKLVSMENDDSCLIAYSRVCDMQGTIVENGSWTKQETGLWIDVFPVDGADDNYIHFKKRYLRNTRTWISLFRNRIIERGQHEENSRKMNILIKFLEVSHLKWVDKIIAFRKRNLIDKNARILSYGTTRHCTQMVCCDDGPKSYFCINDFSLYTDLPFEGYSLKAISGYDRVLKQIYGDYLQLPPQERRIPHLGGQKVYWRKNQ